MNGSASAVAARVLRYALIAASFGYIAVYVGIAAVRLRYPFDLEWMEGGSVDHVVRVLQHQPLYVPPQIAFIPFEYPPLYYYASALVASVVGIGYFPLRLVSFASSLVCFACLYRVVRTDTNSSVAGFLAAGLFAATFRISGAWMDLARVDTMFLALFLVAIVILHRETSWRWLLLAGILLGLSFLTKQTALPMALPVVLYALVARGRAAWWLAGGLLAIVGISTAALHLFSDGWFTVYVWEFPFKHVFATPVWVTFWTRDMFASMPVAFTCALLLVAWQLVRHRREDLFWLAIFIGMIGAAYRSRLQTGGYDNVLLPAYAATAMFVGVLVGRIVQADGGPRIARSRVLEGIVYAVCLVQMVLLRYDVRAEVPGSADRAAGQRLLEVLSSVRGEVLLPYHGYLPMVVGKPSHAHLMQVFDILKFGDERSARLAEQFRVAIRQTAFDAIVLDDTTSYFFMPEIEASYELQSRVFDRPGVFYPVTGGLVVRPEYVYVPKAHQHGDR